MMEALTEYIIHLGIVAVIAVIFAESGLLVGFFLPGDSLLFMSGFLTQQSKGGRRPRRAKTGPPRHWSSPRRGRAEETTGTAATDKMRMKASSNSRLSRAMSTGSTLVTTRS